MTGARASALIYLRADAPVDIDALLVAQDGALWVATSAGLGRYVSPQNQ